MKNQQEVKTLDMSAYVKVLDGTIDLSTIEPNVTGYAIDMGEKGLYVPLVYSSYENEGNVGRLIVQLRLKYPVVKFPNVLSPKLAIMLLRRGFKLEKEYFEECEEEVEVWVWRDKESDQC